MDIYLQQNCHYGVLKVSVYLEINSILRFPNTNLVAYLNELSRFECWTKSEKA